MQHADHLLRPDGGATKCVRRMLELELQRVVPPRWRSQQDRTKRCVLLLLSKWTLGTAVAWLSVYVVRKRNAVCSMLVVNVFSARVREMVGLLGACHSVGLWRHCSRYFARQSVSCSLVAPGGPERKFLVKAARADVNCLGLFRIRFGSGQVFSC